MAFCLRLDPADDIALSVRAVALGVSKQELTRNAVREALRRPIDDSRIRSMLVAASGIDRMISVELAICGVPETASE